MADLKPEALVSPTAPSESTSTTTPSKQSFPAPPVYPTFQFPPNLPTPPFIDIEGIPNFRELGGYLCQPKNIAANGEKYILRRGLLYRCAQPTQITQQGVSTFSGDLGIKAVYDLRSAPEVARTNAAVAASVAAAAAAATDSSSAPSQPFFEIPGSTRHFTPVFVGEDYSPDGLSRRLRWYGGATTTSAPPASSSSPDGTTGIEVGAYSPGFLNAYRDILSHGSKAYTTIFKHILNTPSDALMFHCTAGKDRTGVLAALIMTLAGVDPETIAWEYSLTEPGLGSSRTLFIKRMIEHGINAGPNPSENAKTLEDGRVVESITLEEARNICGSRAGNMRAFLRFILQGEVGGVEKYLQEKCGFTKEEVEKIRRNLVVKVDESNKKDVIGRSGIEGWTPDGGVQD